MIINARKLFPEPANLVYLLISTTNTSCASSFPNLGENSFSRSLLFPSHRNSQIFLIKYSITNFVKIRIRSWLKNATLFINLSPWNRRAHFARCVSLSMNWKLTARARFASIDELSLLRCEKGRKKVKEKKRRKRLGAETVAENACGLETWFGATAPKRAWRTRTLARSAGVP